MKNLTTKVTKGPQRSQRFENQEFFLCALCEKALCSLWLMLFRQSHLKNQTMKRISLFLLITLIASRISNAQNLDMVGKEKPFTMNGGLSLNQTAYASSDSLSRRDPYNYYLSGNVNFSIYGWSVPFSFNYSNQKTTFTQPFNNYCLHPQYKWIRTHIGYTGMSFSPYTLNGHLFLGAGVELAPKGPFTFSAMYGRLKRATSPDTSSANPLPAEYERWGYGMKAGYSYAPGANTKVNIGLSVFHAKDRHASLSYLYDSSYYPGENLVLGTNIDVSFASHFTFSAEVASSAIIRNILSTVSEGETSNWNNFMGILAGSNGTTEYYDAQRYNLAYNTDIYSVGIGYERIDPGYETYGAYYFNNDMQNVTLNGSVRLLQNKVNVSANVGRQNDNLDKSKAGEMKRWVTAFNLGFNPGEKLNTSLSYSTFTSFMNIRSQFTDINRLTPYDNLDTLNFTQLSSSASASLSYILKNTEKTRQNLSLNISQQQSAEKQGDMDTLGGSVFYNINSSFSNSLVPFNLTVSAAFNAGINNMPGMHSTTLGPSVSVNKLMLDKKLRNSLTCAYNRSYADGNAMNRILSIRANSGYRIGKRHNLTLGLTCMNRKNISTTKTAATEFIANLAYSMSF